MMELYFYDVPVYRLSEKEYYDQRAKFVHKMVWETGPKELLPGFYERNPDRKIWFEDHCEKLYGGPWSFNEAIGYIRMHFLGSQVRGEFWAVTSKHIVRTRKKTIFYRTHKIVGEMSIPRNATNAQIFSVVVEYLESAKRHLKGRVVDDSLLRLIGPFVNWKELIEAHNKILRERRKDS